MTRISLNLISDDSPDAYLIDDPVEKLEMHYPRETLLCLLEQQYGPEVKLERTKDSRANGVPYKCLCPVHHNPTDPRGLVYLDQCLRVHCQSCMATRTLRQLLENCEIDPADIQQHVLENLDQLRQRFERLDPDIEEELLRSWQGDLLTGSIDLPTLEKTTHINPPLPPSVAGFERRIHHADVNIPDSWSCPPELEKTLLDLKQAISIAATWTCPIPDLQSSTAVAEQDQIEFQYEEGSSSETLKPKAKQKQPASSLIGAADAQSDLTMIITSTVATRNHLLTCEKFRPVIIAPATGSLHECATQLSQLPSSNFLLVVEEEVVVQELAKTLFKRTQKPVMQLKLPRDRALLSISTKELAELAIHNIYPPKRKTTFKVSPIITSMQELLTRDLPPRHFLLDPLLPEQSIILVVAAAGTGKTFFAMEIAYAAATGGNFLDWVAPEPAGVLYVDGELPLNLLQERIRLLHQVHKLVPDNFNLLARDEQEKGIPCLSQPEGQEFIEQALQPDTKLIVLDNISTLVRNGLENESRSWQPIQDWTLEMRLRG